MTATPSRNTRMPSSARAVNVTPAAAMSLAGMAVDGDRIVVRALASPGRGAERAAGQAERRAGIAEEQAADGVEAVRLAYLRDPAAGITARARAVDGVHGVVEDI